jgi:hypothetical protein
MEEMGLMRMRNGWLVWLLTGGLALAPAVVRGQGIDPGPPDPVFPVPLNNHLERGGFYVALEGIMWRQTNPLHDEQIAVRGVLDEDGTIAAALGLPQVPGQFFGSRQAALRANDVGPGTYTPGFRMTTGWKFPDGIAIEGSWTHLFETQYAATASVLPAFGLSGPLLENTFLTSFVFNFPPDFAGPAMKVNLGSPGATFGIWDAASEEVIRFIQRYDQFALSVRVPFTEGECLRTYWMAGPRLDWLWEQFWWRTVAFDIGTGNAGQDDVAIYSNVLSQRLYGAHLGCGWDWRLGDTPVGTFAIVLELEGALFADIAKERAKYERGDFAIASQRARTDYTIVPEVNGKINLAWYPMEGLELRLGWDFMAFFNTISAPDPVSFNYGALDPPWVKGTFRFFEGLTGGVSITF